MLVLAAGPLAAQGGFIKPDPRVDSTTATARDAYLRFRDTLRAVDAASSRLTRDLRTASSALLLSRVRAVRTACAGSLRSADPVRTAMLTSGLASRVPMNTRTELERSMIALRGSLSQCSDEYAKYSTPERSAEVRDAGAAIAQTTINAARKFEQAAEAYLLVLGVRIRPHGAGPNPFAGRAN